MQIIKTLPPSRIASLPRRDWQDHAQEIAQVMTEALRTPNGTQSLRPVQGVTLFEAATVGGVYSAIIVGGGKTLIAALAPTVMHAKRPLLIVPAPKKDAEDSLDDLRLHWQIVANYPVITYNWLDLKAQHDYLERGQFDLIVCDESQNLKDPDRSSSRKIDRYLEAHPECRKVDLTASPTKDNIDNFGHQFYWCLRDNSPLPTLPDVREAWGRILNPDGYGDLSIFNHDLGKCITPAHAREKVAERITSAPGVIISADPFNDVNLTFEPWEYEIPEVCSDFYPNLRNKWIAPDGFPLTDAQTEVWAAAMRLAVGLVYRWDPWPPEPWRDARRCYGAAVRCVLGMGRLDTESQVREAILTGTLDGDTIDRVERYCGKAPWDAWHDWQEIQPTFIPNPIKEVISEHMVHECERWLSKRGKGIIWVRHRELGKLLSTKLGLPYHGQKRRDAAGNHIEQATTSVVASTGSCGVGCNLQGFKAAHFTNNFFVEFPNDVEQCAGRTHRSLQVNDVTVDYAWGCLEHSNALGKAIRNAYHAQNILKVPQKLLQYPPRRASLGDGPAWDPPMRDDLDE